jgi:hypothetical protein
MVVPAACVWVSSQKAEYASVVAPLPVAGKASKKMSSSV